MADTFRYDSFISYRHRQPDQQWADWLVRALETYAPPRSLRKALEARGGPSRVTRVFRDEDETSAGDDLSQQLKTALEQSRTLIVVCSRNTPASPWVNQEVKYFESLGRALRILPLLVEGEPAEAFPPALLDHAGARIAAPAAGHDTDVEPLAADVRPVAGTTPREIKRRALLKLVAAALDVRYDDLYQRDRRRRRVRMAAIAAVICTMALGSLSWLAWTGTDTYQINAVLRDGPPLVSSAGEDAAAVWAQALAYTGRVDDATRAAEATGGFGGAQVKAFLALADAVATTDPSLAERISQMAVARIAAFMPAFRAELAAFAAKRISARGDREAALRVARAALDDTATILDTAERVSAAETLSRQIVQWDAGAGATERPDAIASSILQMESARAAKRAGRQGDAARLAVEAVERARSVDTQARAYVTAFLADAAAEDGIPLPPTYLSGAVTAANALTVTVARSQSVGMAVRALARIGSLDAARPLLKAIAVDDDRDEAVKALLAGYARHGRAADVGTLLEESAGRDDFDRYDLVSAAAEGAAEGGRSDILPLLDRYASDEERVEMRVIAAERMRALGLDNQGALTRAMQAVLEAGKDNPADGPQSRIVVELAASNRLADARTVTLAMSDPHARVFGWIPIASAALHAHNIDEAVTALQQAELAARMVKDPDELAGALLQIARLLQMTGREAQALALFRTSFEQAATQGEAGSSTVADALVELARMGERRTARVVADRTCTADDRLRVYAAILSPRARGLGDD